MAALSLLTLALLTSLAQWDPPALRSELDNFRSQAGYQKQILTSQPQTLESRISDDDIECPEKSGRFPYPDDCSKYIECRNGKPSVRSCPHTLKFDRRLGCILPTIARCEDKIAVRSKGQFVPEHCLFVDIHNQIICQTFDEWNNTAAHSCLDRAMHLRSFEMLLPCGVDLFSGVAFVCCPKNEFICPEPYGKFHYHGDCHKYYECMMGTVQVKTCPNNEQFDETEGCVVRNTPCPASEMLTPSHEAQPSSNAAEQMESPQFDGTWCPESYGRWPHPVDCKKYVECVRGVPTVKSCPRDFDYDKNFGCIFKSFSCPKKEKEIRSEERFGKIKI